MKLVFDRRKGTHSAARRVLAAGFLVLCSASALRAAPQEVAAEYDLSVKVHSPRGTGRVQVEFSRQENGDGYLLHVDAHALVLSRREQGRVTPLESFEGLGLSDARKYAMKITIQRCYGRIGVLVGSRLLLNVQDSRFSGGVADLITSAGADAEAPAVQPVEALYFSDDFMRQPDEPGEWTYAAGKWRIQTVGVVERGANPFSLESLADPVGLATAGYNFWSDYSFEAAVKGSGATAFGICADLQNDQNYYLLRWTPGTAGALELIRMVDGRPTTLARQEGGFISGLWYRVRLRSSGGNLTAEVDGQPVLSAYDTTFGKGKVALYSESNGKVVWFDSILVRPAGLVHEELSRRSPLHWQVQNGKALGGDPEWKNYSVTLKVTGSRELMGIPLHYRDSENYDALIWNTERVRLFSVHGGNSQLLSIAGPVVRAGRSHTVQAGVSDGYLWGAVDGKRVVEGLDPAISSGLAGFQPTAFSGTAIHSVSIQTEEPPSPTDVLTAEFTHTNQHPDMAGWAGPLHAWQRGQFGDRPGYWHKGHLYGDTSISIPLKQENLKDCHLSIILNGNGSDADEGYMVDYKAAGGAISLSLFRDGKPITTVHSNVPRGEDTVRLKVERKGSFVFAGLGGRVELQFHDPQPLDGYRLPWSLSYAASKPGRTRLGLVLRQQDGVDVPGIAVNNPLVYAETFHLAPINWRPQRGAWEVSSRWSCQPGWTWYGGKASGYAVNWHKTPLWGDQSIDYYAAAMMSATPQSGRESWRDMNCAFCADGVNLFSGYSLIIGAWQGGAPNRLYRKGHLVATNQQFRFPQAEAAHRLWYNVQIAKSGGHISVRMSYVDAGGQGHSIALMDWTDPEPLPGGFAAFWTYDNGMMLARAVLSSQARGRVPLYLKDKIWMARQPDNLPYPESPAAGEASANLVSPQAISLARFAPEVGEGPFILNPVHTAAAPPPPPTLHSTRDAAAGPQHIRVADLPVPVHAGGLTFYVDPGGTLSHVRFRGREVIKKVVMDIRSAEWHTANLTAENARVNVIPGDEPEVNVRFNVVRPDYQLSVAGTERIRILPGNVMRVEASIDPAENFQSNRISVNLVIPSEDYTGHSFVATLAGVRRTYAVPSEPLWPIQFCAKVQRLTLPVTGLDVRPLAGAGVLEDLRHYGLNELWFEQMADYPFPQVQKGQRRQVSFNIHFSDAPQAQARLEAR